MVKSYQNVVGIQDVATVEFEDIGQGASSASTNTSSFESTPEGTEFEEVESELVYLSSSATIGEMGIEVTEIEGTTEDTGSGSSEIYIDIIVSIESRVISTFTGETIETNSTKARWEYYNTEEDGHGSIEPKEETVEFENAEILEFYSEGVYNEEVGIGDIEVEITADANDRFGDSSVSSDIEFMKMELDTDATTEIVGRIP